MLNKCRLLSSVGAVFLASACATAARADEGQAPVAAAVAAPPAGCAGEAYRQFDFWAGAWTVKTEDGTTMLGESHVDPILGGCVLHEHWTGSKGFKGESFNIFDAELQHWVQTWVDQGGSTLRLIGGLQGNTMVLEGSHSKAGGPASTERISWTPLADGRVRQWWQTSADAGKTWTTSFDGYYQRRP